MNPKKLFYKPMKIVLTEDNKYLSDGNIAYNVKWLPKVVQDFAQNPEGLRAILGLGVKVDMQVDREHRPPGNLFEGNNLDIRYDYTGFAVPASKDNAQYLVYCEWETHRVAYLMAVYTENHPEIYTNDDRLLFSPDNDSWWLMAGNKKTFHSEYTVIPAPAYAP